MMISWKACFSDLVRGFGIQLLSKLTLFCCYIHPLDACQIDSRSSLTTDRVKPVAQHQCCSSKWCENMTFLLLVPCSFSCPARLGIVHLEFSTRIFFSYSWTFRQKNILISFLHNLYDTTIVFFFCLSFLRYQVFLLTHFFIYFSFQSSDTASLILSKKIYRLFGRTTWTQKQLFTLLQSRLVRTSLTN